MRSQYRNLAATHPCIAGYAGLNFTMKFFPYRPCNAPPCAAGEKFARTMPPPVFPYLLSYCPRTIVPNFTGGVKVSPLYGLTFFRFGNGIFRDRNANLFAARLILRFSQRMDRAINAGSKLCAEVPRHAQVMRPLAACLRSTSKEGETPSVGSFPLCRKRHVETLPVSTPSGFRRPASLPSCAVRP
jgi:hypothetical protein